MLRAGIPVTEAAGLETAVRPSLGRAERLPFADETFDAVTFTYLLRYVDDPEATVRELARVLRPGGTLASLEFFRPEDRTLHAGWWAYTRLVMPVVGAVVSPAWRYTGRFLGPEHQQRSTIDIRSPSRSDGGSRRGCVTSGRASCRSAPASSSGR